MLIVLSGPSGVGKDSVWIPAAEALGFAKRLMHTSREPRPGERNGADYWFVSKRNFKSLLRDGRFVEWDYYFYSYYGIGVDIVRDAVEHDVVFHAIARLGARFRAKVPGTVLVSLMPSSRGAMLRRLKEKRKYDSFELCMRRHHITEEMDNSFLCDYAVQNAESADQNEAREVLGQIADIQRSEQVLSRRRGISELSRTGVMRIKRNQW
jgi:guanylate kinase